VAAAVAGLQLRDFLPNRLPSGRLFGFSAAVRNLQQRHKHIFPFKRIQPTKSFLFETQINSPPKVIKMSITWPITRTPLVQTCPRNNGGNFHKFKEIRISGR
jgi:hypothetical protein